MQNARWNEPLRRDRRDDEEEEEEEEINKRYTVRNMGMRCSVTYRAGAVEDAMIASHSGRRIHTERNIVVNSPR